MTALRRNSCWRGRTAPLIAAICLAGGVAAGSADAASTPPSAKPLWDVYPLGDGSQAAKPRPPAAPASPERGPSDQVEQLRPAAQSASLGVLILFYGCIGGAVVALAGLGWRRMAQRRRREAIHG